MADEKATIQTPEAPVSVIVTSFPEAPHKPLFKDSARLISVAAFVFSLVTGGYAVYQSWRNERQATLDGVLKLVDQYYLGQEKLATLNKTTQLPYINLLQSEIKAIAAHAEKNASRISGDIDAGTWLALAQINQYEGNFNASINAWNAAINATDEDYAYTFALRGLATVQILQGKLKEASNSLDLAFRSETTEEAQFKRISNRMLPIYRLVDAAQTQAYYLVLFKPSDCASISQHFDSAQAMALQAHQQNQGDSELLNRIFGVRLQQLEQFRRQRSACTPIEESWELSNDSCYFLALILDSAPFGFGPLKGAFDKDTQSSHLLVPLLDSNDCDIDASSVLSCGWPESDDLGTKDRSESLIQTISTCRNLPPVGKFENTIDSPTRTTETTKLHPAGRSTITIKRDFAKPSATRPSGRWYIFLEILPTGF